MLLRIKNAPVKERVRRQQQPTFLRCDGGLFSNRAFELFRGSGQVGTRHGHLRPVDVAAKNLCRARPGLGLVQAQAGGKTVRDPLGLAAPGKVGRALVKGDKAAPS